LEIEDEMMHSLQRFGEGGPFHASVELLLHLFHVCVANELFFKNQMSKITNVRRSYCCMKVPVSWITLNNIQSPARGLHHQNGILVEFNLASSILI
jgi:hypothetical protein